MIASSMQFLVAVGIVLAVLGCSTQVPPDSSGQSDNQTVPAVEQTLTGGYYQGDGLGFNLDLHLRENGTFTCSWAGCLGEYGTTDGTWIRVGDRIVVTTDNAVGEFAGRSLGSMTIVQHDGETRLLRDVDAELVTEPELLPYFSFGRDPEAP